MSDSPGWDAIDAALAKIYGDQEPSHYGTIIKWRLGGNDPLDGMSAYKRNDHWHYVSYGLTELYEKESDDPDASGYGFELTFRLKCTPGEAPPVWPMSLMQNLARYVFQTGNVFAAGHHVNANGPIAAEEITKLTAILFTEDPELKTIATPHGDVAFLQMVGITGDELEAVQAWNSSKLATMLASANPLWLTDLERSSILDDPAAAQHVNEGIEKDGSSMGELYTSTVEWSRDGGALHLTLDALGIKGLKRQLRGRLLHDRPLFLTGASEDPQHCVVLQTGDAVGFGTSDAGLLTITVPREQVEAMATQLEPKRGDYTWPGIPGLRVTVIAVDVKNPDGSVSETVG